MRKKLAARNAFVAVILNIVTVLIGFVAQKVFIETLGEYYLGINGLFSSIIGILTMADMGVGSAVSYYLYGYLAKNKKDNIVALLRFYRKICHIVAGVVLVAGVIVMFFIPSFIDLEMSHLEASMIFMMFILDAMFTYLLMYKRVLLQSDQKNYIISAAHIGYIVVVKAAQIVTLLVLRNFYVYFLIGVAGKVIESVVLNKIVDRQYPYILEKEQVSLDRKISSGIRQRVHGLIYHRIAAYVVTGTDNLLIAKFFGVVQVGLYSNYFMLISGVNMLFSQAFYSATASVGNLLIKTSKDYSFGVIKKIIFASSWIYMWAGICLILMVEPFIRLWLGEGFLLGMSVLVWLSISFYIEGVRVALNTLLEAGGITYENRFVPVFEMVSNIVLSIVFAHFFGLSGIFMGTVASKLVLHFYGYPKYAFGMVLRRGRLEYVRVFVKYAIITAVIWVVSGFIGRAIIVDNIFIELVLRLGFCFIVPNALFIISQFKTVEFRYFKELLGTLVRKFLKRSLIKK
ncbi:sugar translocase [Clostridia bacterium]|nr:sugar translocase [Clostridia bacterium]